MKEFVNIAKISGTHHLKGTLKAISVFDQLDIIIGKKVMLESPKGIKKIFTVNEISRMNDKRITLNLEEINNINEAKELLNYKVFVKRDNIIDEMSDEFLISDLIDMEVETVEGETLGTVSDIISTAAHDIYVINEGKEEIMIPAVDEFIKKIDFENNKMLVSLIEGMR